MVVKKFLSMASHSNLVRPTNALTEMLSIWHSLSSSFTSSLKLKTKLVINSVFLQGFFKTESKLTNTSSKAFAELVIDVIPRFKVKSIQRLQLTCFQSPKTGLKNLEAYLLNALS